MIPWKASSARQLYKTVIKVWKLRALAKLVGGAKYCICMKNKTIFTQSGLICTKNRFLLKQTLTTFDLPRKQIKKQIYESQSSWNKTLTPSLLQKTVLKKKYRSFCSAIQNVCLCWGTIIDWIILCSAKIFSVKHKSWISEISKKKNVKYIMTSAARNQTMAFRLVLHRYINIQIWLVVSPWHSTTAKTNKNNSDNEMMVL